MAVDIPVIEEIVEGKITTVIADDLEIKGTIKFKSSVMLKGIFEGEIQSEGLLVIGPTAKVTATITTKTLISHGEITGNVTAGEQIILKGTATHSGDLKAPFITVDNGAVFNGAAIMERKRETETSIEAYEETPVAASESMAFDQPVSQLMGGKPDPFVVAQPDQVKKQSKGKTLFEKTEKTEGSMNSGESTGEYDKYGSENY